jgi:pantoate--beta-alanine ligase
METARSIAEATKIVDALRHPRRVVGLVPTMGALHEGHMSLARAARLDCDVVIATVFVNPTQFGRGEDFERYPRDFERDAALLESEKVDLVFTTTPEEMYPGGYATFVVQEGLEKKLCGRSRPGHFRGVLTVVMKLFNIFHPDFAYFGQKDAQQVIMIRRMAADLHVATVVKSLPTVREEDGLAMSSRNAYLSADERRQAACLYRALSAAKNAAAGGEREPRKLVEMMKKEISAAKGAKIDYAEVVDPETLEAPAGRGGRMLLALAARIGSTRLIDNICLDSDGTETLC